MGPKLRNISGVALLIAGGAGLLLPIIPGIPLIIAGAAMLGSNHPIVRAGRTWLQDRGILKRRS